MKVTARDILSLTRLHARGLSGAAKASLRLARAPPYKLLGPAALPSLSVRLCTQGIAIPTLYHIVLFHRLSLWLMLGLPAPYRTPGRWPYSDPGYEGLQVLQTNFVYALCFVWAPTLWLTRITFMTVGYYRLPNWACCESGSEHQNTAPFNECYSDMTTSFYPSLLASALKF